MVLLLGRTDRKWRQVAATFQSSKLLGRGQNLSKHAHGVEELLLGQLREIDLALEFEHPVFENADASDERAFDFLRAG